MCLLQPIFETVEEVSGLVIGGMLSSFWLFEVVIQRRDLVGPSCPFDRGCNLQLLLFCFVFIFSTVKILV